MVFFKNLKSTTQALLDFLKSELTKFSEFIITLSLFVKFSKNFFFKNLFFKLKLIIAEDTTGRGVLNEKHEILLTLFLNTFFNEINNDDSRY